MSFYNDVTLNYLKGKSIYAEVRRIISFLLKISITTYVYTYFFGTFKVLQFSEYKEIIDFFLSGRFVIPLSVFLIVHVALYIIQSFLFHLLTFVPIFKLKKKIINYHLTPEDKKEGKDAMKQLVKYTIKKDVSDEELAVVYMEYKHKMERNVNADLKITEDLEKELIQPKINAQANFDTTILVLVAMIVFYTNISDFPIVLFVIVLVLTISFSITSIVLFRFLDILPTILLRIPEILHEHKNYSEIRNKEG